MSFEESHNVRNENELLEFAITTATENIGMPMVYTIVSALIEKLNKDNDDRKVFEEKERERKEKEREEEELVTLFYLD
jgi:hypothetical protein